jgi:endonuclease-8
VHVHLGLYGRFSDQRLPAHEPRGQVRMRMIGQTHCADLRGPTACALLTEAEVDAIRARLGADPLRTDADPEGAWVRISRSSAPLATLLMDQSVIAGVGNVYRAEVLFRLGLDPQLPGKVLRRDQWDAIWADLVALLRAGYEVGKIETVRPEHDPTLYPMDGVVPCARAVYAYRRTGEPCLVCGTPIAHSRHLARNLFWCPTCQAPKHPEGRGRGTEQARPVEPQAPASSPCHAGAPRSTGSAAKPFMRNDGERSSSSSGTARRNRG